MHILKSLFFTVALIQATPLQAEVKSLGLKSHHLDFQLVVSDKTLEFKNNGLMKTLKLNKCGHKEARQIVRALLPQFAQWLRENSAKEVEDNAQIIIGERVLPIYLNKRIDSTWARMPASVDSHLAALEAKCSKEK